MDQSVGTPFKNPQPVGPWRWLAALLIGLAGAVVIWVVTPYNNFIIGGGYVSDSFLPVVALALILLLVLVVSPLLRLLRPRWALNQQQLAVIFGILLVASVIPGQGLLRALPYAIGRVPRDVSENQRLAQAYHDAGISPRLFPDRIGFNLDVPASTHFITELPPGESIPWSNWLRGPLWTWGLLLLGMWVMMAGLSQIVYPQWRHNERLSFPLLTLQQSVIEDPEEGRLWAPMFRSRAFWLAAGAVFVLHFMAGWHTIDPEAVPAVPLNWNLSGLFTEEPLRFLPAHIHTGRLYFIFLGMAFFMTARIGFSMWFLVLGYALYVMFGKTYVPEFSEQSVRDHRWGAMLVVTGAILWLGRAHWSRVLRLATGLLGAGTDEDRRDRLAGWMFLAGCAGIFVWLLTLGNVQWWWALFFLAWGVCATLLIARVVAETGVPFVRIDAGYQVPLVYWIGAHLSRANLLGWLSMASMYGSTVVMILFDLMSRISPVVMMTHALGLDAQASPRKHVRLAWLSIGVLVLGLFVGGAVHLAISYHHSGTLDGREQPVSSWGTGLLGTAHNDLLRLQDGRFNIQVFNRPTRWDLGAGHMVFGAGLAAGLFVLCVRWPAWPLHPIGLLMVGTFYANEAWVSVFLGWMLKTLVLRWGGARLYRQARPLFLGLIMGEVFAAVYWGFDPAVRIALGLPYTPIMIQPR